MTLGSSLFIPLLIQPFYKMLIKKNNIYIYKMSERDRIESIVTMNTQNNKNNNNNTTKIQRPTTLAWETEA